MKNISFYKENGQWYADVPEHTKEENEMVSGADTFLEEISKSLNDSSVIKMRVSDNNEFGRFLAKLILKKHDDFGATYVVTGSLADELGYSGKQIWLCNVMHTVMGEHPESIYIHSIDGNELGNSLSLINELNAKAYAEERMRSEGLYPHFEVDRAVQNMSREEIIELLHKTSLYLFNSYLIRR